MLRSDEQDSPLKAKAPCVACGEPSQCEIWAHAVCYPCAADWEQASPTYGQIFEKYGKDANAADVYAKFTERWVESRNAKARAG